jgi:hypothetical protein
MKKVFFCSLFLLFCFTIFGQEYKILSGFDFMFHCDWPLKIRDGKRLEQYENSKWREVKGLSYKVNSFGFFEILEDKSITIILDNRVTCIASDFILTDDPVLNKNQLVSIKSEGNYSETINGRYIDYKVDNLRNAIVWGSREEPFWFNNDNTPFVFKPGKSGIGDKILLEFVHPQREISILGGFVNIKRQDLFKKNNRIKKIIVRDKNSNYAAIVDFEDIAMFQNIKLDTYLTTIEIEILEVYKGSKYDDTCISGIMISNFNDFK